MLVRLRACRSKLTTLHYRGEDIRGDIIKTYKIVSGKYDEDITPTLIVSDTRVARCNDYDFKSYVSDMTHVNFILPRGSLITGIACQSGF